MPADRRWSVGRTPEMTWRSKRIETETSCCHSRSNARWILESSSLEGLGMKTASRKLPKSLRLYRLFLFFFFFFFRHFRCFFSFFLPKSWPTSKWDKGVLCTAYRRYTTPPWQHPLVRPRNVVVLILYPSRSFAQLAGIGHGLHAPRSFPTTSPDSTPYTLWRKVVRAR